MSARVRWPRARVAAIVAVPAARVSTTARTGEPRRPPASERALGSIVTVYSVSGRQCSAGATVRRWPAVSHRIVIASSGVTRSAPATDAASIGASNEIWIGALSAWPVRTASRTWAATGTGAAAGTAELRAGGRLAAATTAMIAAAPRPAAMR